MSQLDKSARARHLYLEGQPQKEIARALGVSENAVTGWKQKQGWPEQPTVAALAAQQKAAFGMFREGLSQQQIAQQFGVSENTVTAWKKKFHWVARLGLLRDKAVDEALAQLNKMVGEQVSRYHAGQMPRQAESLQRAFAYICEQLDRGELVNGLTH